MITVKDYEEHPDDADLSPYEKFRVAVTHQILNQGYVTLQTNDLEIRLDYRDPPDRD